MAKRNRPKPLVLMLLDGWGISFIEKGNAITQAETPNMDRYLREYPAAAIHASGIEVGLPWGEVGNSETGHKNMGAGRVIYQSLPRITLAIRDGEFFANPAFLEATGHVKKHQSRLHLMGLTSDGGVHAHIDHLIALIDLAAQQKITDVFIHVFTDGRDTPPISAGQYLSTLDKHLKKMRTGTIASIIGRHYALDRNNKWDRTRAAYDLLVHGTGSPFPTWKKALEDAYDHKETDEKIMARVIVDKTGTPLGRIQDGDAVIFFDYRPDRARQLTYAFVKKNFSEFPAEQFRNFDIVTMTEYDKALPVSVAYPEEYTKMPLAAVISEAHMAQLHIAETEKYAHVTYFINNGRERPFPREDQVLIPSPDVADYATVPEMGAERITDRVLREIAKEKYDVIIMNYANADMIAHTGKIRAAVIALTFLDTQIGRVVDATLDVEGAVLITCDHGNAEEMRNAETGAIVTDHSANPVPLLYLTADNRQDRQKTDDMIFQILSTPIGVLADVGPTVLDILQLKKPKVMTAQSLLDSLL